MDSHPELPPFIDTQRLWQLKCPDRFLKECLRPEMIWTLPRDDADGDKGRERRVEIVGLKPGTCRWERIDDREIFLADCRRKRLCITIDAGVGKTTALRQIQYLRQVGDNRDGLALCCEFAELPPTWDKYLPTAALGFLAGKLGKSDNPLWRDADPRLFRSLILRKIRSGKFTMLVDALDQSAPRVNAKFDALAACKGLVDFLTNYPQVRFVVSGRPYAIQTYWEPLFERTGPWDIVKVDLFTPAQAKRYVGDERNELLMHLGADVVSIPRSLEMIREIQGDFSGLRTKSDVYWRSLIGMLEKARHLQNPGLVLDESDSLFLFALIAFEMTRRGLPLEDGANQARQIVLLYLGEFPKILQGERGAAAQRIARGFERSFRPIPKTPDASLTFPFGAEDGKRGFDVMIPAPFEMSEFPVTNELFVLFDPTHATREREYNRKFSPEPQCPVINVSWYEAWCCSVWLGGFLPTEEEWEFACRAGATGTYYFPAHESLEDHAWHQDSSERTHPKGGKKANPWDLYDMLGNVAEWCDSRYYDPAILGQDRNRSGWRVFRGGSWHNPDFFCRCADRNADEPGIVLLGVGFRVSRVSRPS